MKRNKMKHTFSESELQAAYETCKLMKSHCDNVLASVGYENSPSDKKWSRTATKFIKAYERVEAYKLAKSKKAGALGNALLILEGMSESINDLSKKL